MKKKGCLKFFLLILGIFVFLIFAVLFFWTHPWEISFFIHRGQYERLMKELHFFPQIESINLVDETINGVRVTLDKDQHNPKAAVPVIFINQFCQKYSVPRNKIEELTKKIKTLGLLGIEQDSDGDIKFILDASKHLLGGMHGGVWQAYLMYDVDDYFEYLHTTGDVIPIDLHWALIILYD